jgi:TctA family transporter
VGAFADREYLFDMGLAPAFGVLGYVARKTGYHVTAILIGVIIGPLFEQYLVRALRLSQGDLGDTLLVDSGQRVMGAPRRLARRALPAASRYSSG